ncbi:asparagine synthase (glutamine-hydrolyzing) [Silvibacterium bohemicum]|uniref:asparagine synthase (glutamine-hydrolyzing) n=1 Tax=Silvibacterium bohemicum TaxID=1577686 RepID=A0A841JXC5_9BACT|nr:asparagine synthase-related protein [Silvibacterium bohemicum]MBB6144389.1 asparagine synthase (glutamine-hydrolyzing) [Silvibacterium bohemicum]
MSVIYGICGLEDPKANREALGSLAHTTARYGADGTFIAAKDSVGMAYQAFHTHGRSHLGHQPYLDARGNMVTLDGRLDNFEELANALGISPVETSDSSLVLSAFEQWGKECFSHFIGEWAVAVWSAQSQVLYMARDHAGSRTLFYRRIGDVVLWSTYLETFCQQQNQLELNKEYLGCLLSCQPVGDLTPYKGIQAVPPAHYVELKKGKMTTEPHWNSGTCSQIHYRTDVEYDEHFLQLFGRAIRRSTIPVEVILAELSGGMDSSSIVCMSDHMSNLANQIDTVSYYDDTEADWDDRPYFQAVERYRQKDGFHVDVSSRAPRYEPVSLDNRAYPYFCGDRSYVDIANLFERIVGDGRYRVILSGIGGDELLGGVPTGMPELANYLRECQLPKLIARTFSWCLPGRQPLIPMLWNTFRSTIDLYRKPSLDDEQIPPWLSVELPKVKGSSLGLIGGAKKLIGAKPSSVANDRTWWSILETLPNGSPGLKGCYEYRFPYLDRDLVDFLHRVPREQLVQPGRRRLLMRRALEGIVPAEVLERKRKAFVSQAPIIHLREGRQRIEKLLSDPLISQYGIVHQAKLLSAFRAALTGETKWVCHVTRAIEAEVWLQGLRAQAAY